MISGLDHVGIAVRSIDEARALYETLGLEVEAIEEVPGYSVAFTGQPAMVVEEMNPTLARMIGARAQSLPRPIKWFCVPRLCRAERPQRGRLREFFQWNIDIVGAGGLRDIGETLRFFGGLFHGLVQVVSGGLRRLPQPVGIGTRVGLHAQLGG